MVTTTTSNYKRQMQSNFESTIHKHVSYNKRKKLDTLQIDFYKSHLTTLDERALLVRHHSLYLFILFLCNDRFKNANAHYTHFLHKLLNMPEIKICQFDSSRLKM